LVRISDLLFAIARHEEGARSPRDGMSSCPPPDASATLRGIASPAATLNAVWSPKSKRPDRRATRAFCF